MFRQPLLQVARQTRPLHAAVLPEIPRFARDKLPAFDMAQKLPYIDRHLE